MFVVNQTYSSMEASFLYLGVQSNEMFYNLEDFINLFIAR